MNEELDYAQMLEIPMETVTVKHRESKKRRRATAEADLGEQLVEEINDRMQEQEAVQENEAVSDDKNFAESKVIGRTEKPKRKRRISAKHVLIGEFAAVCALCAAIFFTNIFVTDSAINTFVRGLFQGKAQTADKRTYQDFALTSVVSDGVEAELTVSETGVLSFTAKCSVYSPANGSVKKINGSSDTGYTVEVKHSDKFSTIVSGLDVVYLAEGDKVLSNVPLGYSDGEGAVSVMMYEGDKLLNCYSVDNNKLAWI